MFLRWYKGSSARKSGLVSSPRHAFKPQWPLPLWPRLNSCWYGPPAKSSKGAAELVVLFGSFNLNPRMTSHEVLEIFKESGALLEGHFVLRSGLHSRQFFQCALALQQMPTVERLGGELAGKVRSLGAVTVVSPAMGGLVLGQEVARQLGLRFIFVEKESGKLALRRGFKISTGDKILWWKM